MIPQNSPVFPSRCIITNSKDDLVWVDGNLDALANPRLARKAMPALVAVAAVGVVAGVATGHVSGRDLKDISKIPGNMGRQEVPEVRFAVDREYYTQWVTRFKKRDRNLRWLLRGGSGFAGLSVILMLGFICAGIGGDVLPTVFGCTMLLGFFAAVLGAFYGVFMVQPLLHGVAIQSNVILVSGAGADFLDSLEDA